MYRERFSEIELEVINVVPIYTVWKFQNFSAPKILCEINSCESSRGGASSLVQGVHFQIKGCTQVKFA